MYLLVLILFGFFVFLNFNTSCSLYHLVSEGCAHPEPSLSPRGHTFSRTAVHFSAPSFQFSRAQCSDLAGLIFVPNISPDQTTWNFLLLGVMLYIFVGSVVAVPHYLLVFDLAYARLDTYTLVTCKLKSVTIFVSQS